MIKLSMSDGYAWHLMEVVALESHHIDFKVYEVTSWDIDTNEPIEKDLYLTGTIKWDGCSHIWFGNEKDGNHDGYLHLCGKTFWDMHAKLMTDIYQYAADNIANYDKDAAE